MKKVVFGYLPKLEYEASEALNTLCTNITFAGEDKKCIQITSCRAQEGKSTISVQAWKTLSEMGHSVAFVDTDLRRSKLESDYGISYSGTKLGLAHYLSRSDLMMEDILYETNLPNAYYIPAGRDVANSMQMLSGKKLGTLLADLRTMVDYVIVDTAPVGLIVDAATVAKWCDGSLLVVTQNVTTKQEILMAKEQLEKTGCPVLGAILNKVDMSKSSSKYYNSGYYNAYRSDYYSSSDSGKKQKR